MVLGHTCDIHQAFFSHISSGLCLPIHCVVEDNSVVDKEPSSLFHWGRIPADLGRRSGQSFLLNVAWCTSWGWRTIPEFILMTRGSDW